ncbi:unnamed protein product [Somion occarium]|uniref:Uncharacterized protein n=1 Tax=Somion occarium TaxID=3059160 RepID=A0ABP1DYK0_9APHY
MRANPPLASIVFQKFLLHDEEIGAETVLAMQRIYESFGLFTPPFRFPAEVDAIDIVRGEVNLKGVAEEIANIREGAEILYCHSLFRIRDLWKTLLAMCSINNILGTA